MTKANTNLYNCPVHEFPMETYDALGRAAKAALQASAHNWCAACARQEAKAQNTPIATLVSRWDAAIGDAA
jgi:hypothetical protein